jgi:predicted dehydrogenase
MSDRIRAGIVGAGFIGEVHANAVRAAGGVVSRVAGSSRNHAAAAAARFHADHAADSVEELVAAGDVDVIHVCTPNASHHRIARLAIEAGKQVICEKPLATNPDDAHRLVLAAAEAGVVAAVPFVYRYYPSVREARARIADDEAGPLRLLHGSYLQDWLSDSEDSNWRVDAAVGGASRAFGDIGVHWCDLMEFITGHRITRLTARMITAHARRGATGGMVPVGTEDGATVLFETDRGAAGSVVLSQVCLGRKNRLWFSFDGSRAAYVFDQEMPDSLWIGGRTVNQVVARCADTLSPAARRYAVLPAGHPQGYQECVNAFIADTYAAIAGATPDGLPTFDDGLRAAILTAAVIESARAQSWVDVPAPADIAR